VLLAQLLLLQLPGSVACALRAAAAAAFCAPAQAAVRLPASAGGAGGLCIYLIVHGALVVSQNSSCENAYCTRWSSATIVQIALNREREMAGRTAGASLGAFPGSPRSPRADATVVRNCISCQPNAVARSNGESLK
jgi:hypothetical protein